jgi:transposase
VPRHAPSGCSPISTGHILIPPTVVAHNRQGFDAAIAEICQGIERYSLDNVIVAIQRTGIYHLPVKRAFASNGFETRIVHPLTTRQYRLPADPGNKTDDTDLKAIHPTVCSSPWSSCW